MTARNPALRVTPEEEAVVVAAQASDGLGGMLYGFGAAEVVDGVARRMSPADIRLAIEQAEMGSMDRLADLCDA